MLCFSLFMYELIKFPNKINEIKSLYLIFRAAVSNRIKMASWPGLNLYGTTCRYSVSIRQIAKTGPSLRTAGHLATDTGDRAFVRQRSSPAQLLWRQRQASYRSRVHRAMRSMTGECIKRWNTTNQPAAAWTVCQTHITHESAQVSDTNAKKYMS